MKIYKIVSELNHILELHGMNIDVEFVEITEVVGGKPIRSRYKIGSIDYYPLEKKVEFSK